MIIEFVTKIWRILDTNYKDNVFQLGKIEILPLLEAQGTYVEYIKCQEIYDKQYVTYLLKKGNDIKTMSLKTDNNKETDFFIFERMKSVSKNLSGSF